MKRRTFLLGGLSLLLSASALAQVPAGKILDIYLDESGEVGIEGEPLVLGALIVDSSYRYKRLEQIREKSKFRPVLRYSSSNKYKKLLAGPYLREFFSSGEMSFYAVAIPKAINAQWPLNKTHRSSVYHHNYAKFIKLMCAKAMKVNLFLETRTTTGEDVFLKKHLEQIDSRLRVKFIHEKESNCIQLADLMTGCIYGEMTNVANKTKKAIVAELRKSLGGGQLARDMNFGKGKFVVRVARHL